MHNTAATIHQLLSTMPDYLEGQPYITLSPIFRDDVSYSFVNNTQPVFAQTRNSGLHSDHWLKEWCHPWWMAWWHRMIQFWPVYTCPYDSESFLPIHKLLGEHQEQRAHYPSFPLQAQCKVWLYNSPYNPVSGLYSGWVLTLYQVGE